MPRWPLVLLLLTSCRGCTSQDVERDDSPKKAKKKPLRVDAVELCMRGVRATTEHVAKCEGGSAWWGSIDRAVEQMRATCNAMVNAAGVRLVEAEIDACVGALAEAACDDVTPPACKLAGSLKAGSPCLYSQQCVADHFCKTEDGPCGKCARLPKGGEACDSICDEGAWCSSGTCKKTLADRDACTPSDQCGRLSRCMLDAKSSTSRCLPLRAEGEACSMGECRPNLDCVGGKCVPRPPPKKPGEACSSMFDCLDFSCVDHTCAALVGKGEPCGLTFDKDYPQCEVGLSCVKGKCVDPAQHCAKD